MRVSLLLSHTTKSTPLKGPERTDTTTLVFRELIHVSGSIPRTLISDSLLIISKIDTWPNTLRKTWSLSCHRLDDFRNKINVIRPRNEATSQTISICLLYLYPGFDFLFSQQFNHSTRITRHCIYQCTTIVQKHAQSLINQPVSSNHMIWRRKDILNQDFPAPVENSEAAWLIIVFRNECNIMAKRCCNYKIGREVLHVPLHAP